MSTKLWKQVRCAFNILFVLLMLAGWMGIINSPVQAAPRDSEPVMLQFTSSKPMRGFAPDRMYAAIGSHTLDMDFVDANDTQHPRSGIMTQTDVPESTPTSNTTPTDTLTSPAVCPPSIGFGETIQCSIVSPSETDTYTFTASAGDKVLVRMSKSSGDLWAGIKVYSPDGTKLCEVFYPSTAEIASCNIPSTGTYSILAYDGFNGTFTGDYYLYLQRLNNPGSTVSIAFGQTLSGSISTPAEMDTYTFAAGAGDKVLVRMGRSSGNVWPGIRVYSPDGTKLCEVFYPSTAEIASCNIPSTGTYSILAYDGFNGTLTGDYYLYLQRLNNPGSTVSITFGQTLPGSISTPAEMDTYTFAAGAGDKVLVKMIVSSGILWKGIRVYGPDGTKLCENHLGEIASCNIPSTGTYSILAYDSFNGMLTGNYYIYLQRLNNPGPVIYVTPVSLDFGLVPVGSTMDLFLTVKNIGMGTLTGNASTAAPFSIVSGGSYSLGYDQSQVVTIRYQPIPGIHTGSVVFTGGGGTTVPVTGKTPAGLPWLILLLD
jgi:hypothetical protein